MEKIINMYLYLTAVSVVIVIIGSAVSVWINRRLRGEKNDK